MKKQKARKDHVDARGDSRIGARNSVCDGQYIIDPPDKISDTSMRILEEVKVRRAEALKLLADH
ncbi:MAG: hypothetical protein OXL40_00775 [Bacteroidota bacterium]|nr:hypothetical protein [Bacteroidota bacterium]